METKFRHAPEYVDTSGRTVQPAQPELSLNDYTNAWKRYCTLLPKSTTSRGRHILRNCVEEALGCPEQLTYALGSFCQSGIQGSRPRHIWDSLKTSPYTPFLWKKYDIGEYTYDLVVYQRPKRSFLQKVFCCGA